MQSHLTAPVYFKGRLALSLAAVLGTATAFGHEASRDAFVDQALRSKESGQIDLILQTNKPFSCAQEVKLAKIGGYVYRNLPIIQSVAVSVPRRKLATLLGFTFVKHVSSDVSVKKTDAYTVSSSGANVAWNQYGASGKGVGVAVVDSGIRTVNDFSGSGGLLGNLLSNNRIVSSTNFASDGLLSGDDQCGHGTHVAGIISGNGRNSSGSGSYQTFYGIAPESKLINVRVLDANGGGKVSQVVAGMAWVVTNKLVHNIRVMNLSVGHEVGESYRTDPLCLAAEVAWKAGIVVVAAAGNDGREHATETKGADNEGFGANYGSITSPGNSPYVITVGAMKSVDGRRGNDTIATYSSRGPTRLDFVVKPDIVAAGNRVVSALSTNGTLDKLYRAAHGVPLKAYLRTSNTGMSSHYFTMSGTSMAAPVVAGAAALMLELDPSLTPDTIKARLMLTADKWASPAGVGDLFTYGAGYLNIPKAINSTVKATSYAMSPTAEKQSEGDVIIVVAQSLLGNLLWGAVILSGDELWGERAMWGKGDITGERAMWGKNTVEPNRAMWGKSVWDDSSSYSVNQACADLTAITLSGER